MVPRAGAMPRRARYLIPAGLPRRREVVAVCAVAVLTAHLLLAQLTLVLAVAFAVVSKTSRWRLWWLLVPAAAGLAWTLAIGPGRAVAGFTAGPSGILWHLSGGHLAGKTGHPLAGFGGAQSWLRRQFPVALICGAAEAALAGWLDWLHTDEWAVRPARPGLVAAVRRAFAASAIRAGAVVTRDGCALGVAAATGAVAELRWAELSRGTLIAGTAGQEVTLAGLQVVHAALRRRKPVIVLDFGDAAIVRALGTACLATGTPLLANASTEAAAYPVLVARPAGAGVAGAAGAAGASQLWGRGTLREGRSADPAAIDLGRVVRERSAAILPADSQELAARACADLASLAADLRRIGVDGDALVWVPCGERVPAQAVAVLLRDSPEAGLSVLIGTTSPAAAGELGGLTGATLAYRVAGQDLAASLATRTGTRLLPASVAAALSGRQRPGADPWTAAPAPGGHPSTGGPGYPSGAVPPDLVPSPVIPARNLLTLGQAEFVLAVSWPRQRLIELGRMVPARLPQRREPAGVPGVPLPDRRPRIRGRAR
jgi:hypothetical protein